VVRFSDSELLTQNLPLLAHVHQHCSNLCWCVTSHECANGCASVSSAAKRIHQKRISQQKLRKPLFNLHTSTLPKPLEITRLSWSHSHSQSHKPSRHLTSTPAQPPCSHLRSVRRANPMDLLGVAGGAGEVVEAAVSLLFKGGSKRFPRARQPRQKVAKLSPLRRPPPPPKLLLKRRRES
jgi:hypothetical protein